MKKCWTFFTWIHGLRGLAELSSLECQLSSSYEVYDLMVNETVVMSFHMWIPDIMQCKSTKKWSATITNGHLFVIYHLYEIYAVVIKIPNQMDNLYLLYPLFPYVNTFAASYLNNQGLNNSCLKSPASTLVDLTFQSRALRSFSLNQLRNLSL